VLKFAKKRYTSPGEEFPAKLAERRFFLPMGYFSIFLLTISFIPFGLKTS